VILGLTGNIAAGKSTVAAELRRRGAAVVDADQLARQVVAAGSPVLTRLAERFGRSILNAAGDLDRERLGQLVFADPQALQDLNAITHPAIITLAERALAELEQKGDYPFVVYDVPLLFEVGADKRVDKILLVTIAEVEQERRLMARNGFAMDEARRRIAAQMPQREKITRADFVVDNSGSLEQLYAAIDAVWPRLLEAARVCPRNR